MSSQEPDRCKGGEKVGKEKPEERACDGGGAESGAGRGGRSPPRALLLQGASRPRGKKAIYLRSQTASSLVREQIVSELFQDYRQLTYLRSHAAQKWWDRFLKGQTGDPFPPRFRPPPNALS